MPTRIMCTLLQRPSQGLDDGIAVPCAGSQPSGHRELWRECPGWARLKSAPRCRGLWPAADKADPRYEGDHPRRPPATLLCGSTGEASSSSAALSCSSAATRHSRPAIVRPKVAPDIAIKISAWRRRYAPLIIDADPLERGLSRTTT